MYALLIGILFATQTLSGQVEPLYTSILGGNGLRISPKGSYLISTSVFDDHSYIDCKQKMEMQDIPQTALSGNVTVLTDSLVLARGRFIVDLSLRSIIDTLPYRAKRGVTDVSPDRRTVAQIMDSGRVVVWNVDN